MIKNFYILGVSVLVTSIAFAEVTLESVRAQLAEINKTIAANEGAVNGLETATQALVAQIKKECGVDLNSTKSGTVSCSRDTYNPLIRQFAQLKDSQRRVGEQLATARQSYKVALKDSKSQLSQSDFKSLVETSNDLNDAEIKRLSVNSKADAVKAEINQAKAAIEQSEQYKLLTKAITNTLNSKLFCQARDRCDEKAGNVYEGDVTAKILSNAANSLARSKVNSKGTPATTK